MGDFIVNTSYTFENVNMKFSPDVGIYVQGDNRTLRFKNCRLFSCDALWKGIEVFGANDRVEILLATQIEDAVTAVKSDKKKGTLLNIANSVFNRNVMCIYLEGEDGDLASENPQIAHLTGVRFSATSPLSQGAVPIYGIRTKNVFRPLSNTQSDNNDNTFENLLYGISAEGGRTRLFVINSHFSENGRVAVEFKGGNLLDVRGSDFTNNRYGISMSNAVDLKCYSNTLTISTSGNIDRALLRVHQPRTNHLLDIRSNFFSISNLQTAFVNAIDVRTNPFVPTMMRVHTNRFDLLNPFNNAQAKQSTGIKITGDLIIGSDLDIEQVNVFNINPFVTNFNVGLELSGGLHRNGLHFINNTFFCSGIGVRLLGSVIGDDNQVSDNRFRTVTSALGLGMQIESFEGLKVCANGFFKDAVRSNYLFSGQSMSTNFVGNSTSAGSFAILPGGTIGQQIDKGNRWKPVFNPDGTVHYNPPVINLNTDPDVVVASKFSVNEPQSVWNPATNTYTYLSELHPFGVSPDVFPLEDAFFDDKGGAQNPVCVDQYTASSHADYGDVAIAQGSFGSWFSQPAVGWDAEQYLYRKLSLYPLHIGAHSSFPSFMSIRASTSVGKFFNLEQKMQEAGTMPAELANQAAVLQSEIADIEAEIATLTPTYPPATEYLDLLEEQRQKIWELGAVSAQFSTHTEGKLTEAWNMLPDITTATTYEWNKMRVYEIRIGSRLFQADTLTETQIDDLKTIGQQCIEDGGKAVLLARGLLSECDYPTIGETVEACYPSIEERSPVSSPEKTQAEVFVVPNPAYDFMFLKATDGGMLSIFTVEGKFVHQTSFTAGENRLSLSLPPGLYFFRCQLENDAARVLKVVIQH